MSTIISYDSNDGYDVTIPTENIIISVVNNNGEDICYYLRQLCWGILVYSNMEKCMRRSLKNNSENIIWVK